MIDVSNVCSEREHQVGKLDEAFWKSLAIAGCGLQVLPAYRDEPEERYEVRNCGCGSTLYRLIEVKS